MSQHEKAVLLLWGLQLLCLYFPGPLFRGGQSQNDLKNNLARSIILFASSLFISGWWLSSLVNGLLCGSVLGIIHFARLRNHFFSALAEYLAVILSCIALIKTSGQNEVPGGLADFLFQCHEEFYVLQAIFILHIFLIPAWLEGISERYLRMKAEIKNQSWKREEQWINFLERSLFFSSGYTGSLIPLVVAILLRLTWLLVFRRDHFQIRMILAFAGIFMFVLSSRILFSIPFLP